MFEPEYRIGLRVLKKEIGFWSTLKAIVPAIVKSLRINSQTDAHLKGVEIKKREIKDHFKLLA